MKLLNCSHKFQVTLHKTHSEDKEKFELFSVANFKFQVEDMDKIRGKFQTNKQPRLQSWRNMPDFQLHSLPVFEFTILFLAIFMLLDDKEEGKTMWEVEFGGDETSFE